MAIDPSIALAVRPVDITAQYATPFQTIGQALSLQNMMRQGQLQSLELQQQQAMWQERQALAIEIAKSLGQQQPAQQTAPSVTPGGTTAAPLPAPTPLPALAGQTPAVAGGPALVGQTPSAVPLAGGAAPTMADLMNLPTIDRGSQMAALAGMPMPATQPADAQTQNSGWPTQQDTPAAPDSSQADTSQPSAPAPAAAASPAPASARPTGAIQNAPALPIPDFSAMIRATPISGLGMQMAENYNKYLKAHYDTLNAQLTNQQNTGKRVAQLAGSIVDEPTKMTAIGQAMAEHLISQEEARRLMTVSPSDQIWQSWANQGKTASEIAADNIAQSRFHLEQVEKAFQFAKAPYEIETAKALAKKSGIEAVQAQRTQDAQMLAAAVPQGQDAVEKVKAQIAAQDPTGQRLAVFGNAKTAKEFAARAQTPAETVSTAITEQQNKITNVREAIKAGQDYQKFNMQYPAGSVDAAVEQVYHNPDTADKTVNETTRPAVQQALKAKYGIPFPKPLTGGQADQETAGKSTLNAVNSIRTALDDPEVANQIGAVLGKLYDKAFKFGTAVGLSPAAAQKAQELRTQMQLLITQEPREFGGRLGTGLIDELKKNGPRPDVNIDLLKGALNGTESASLNQLDNLDKSRFGGQMRPRDVRGLEPSTDVRSAILGQKKGPGMYQMTDGSSWYLTRDGQIIPR